MAVVASRACVGTVNTVGDVITIAADAVGKVRVRNSGATNVLQVQVVAIHGTSDWDEITAGQEVIYASFRPLIKVVNLKAKAATTTYQFGVVMP